MNKSHHDFAAIRYINVSKLHSWLVVSGQLTLVCYMYREMQNLSFRYLVNRTECNADLLSFSLLVLLNPVSEAAVSNVVYSVIQEIHFDNVYIEPMNF